MTFNADKWVTSREPSLCGGGACVEVFWAGRAVNVRDTKLDPLLSPVLRFEVWQWRELLAAIVRNVTHPAVSVGDDGTVRLGVEHLHGGESLTFTEQEWSDFARGVRDGWYEPDLLKFYAAHGLAVRGIGATARLSGPESPGRGGDEGRTAGSVSADRSGGVAAGTVSGGRSRGSAVPVAAELGPLDDELDVLNSPAGRDLSGNPREGFPDAVATTDRPGAQPPVPLAAPLNSPAGRPVDASTGEVVLSLADRPGSDAAGTGVPPDLVPAAPEELRIARRERDSLARRLGERFRELEETRTRLAWMTEERDAYQAEVEALTDQLGDMRAALSAAEVEVDLLRADANEWAKATAPLVPTDGAP